MRVERVILRNFRGVAEREVEFAASGVTVVQGPNEIGKSSLADAIDLLLTQPDRSAKKEIKAIQSIGVDAGPEVEMSFRVGGQQIHYAKRWLRSPCTTATIGREQLAGRDAHNRICALLDEHVDLALWRALRISQQTPVDQADLAGHASLSATLDAASDAAPSASDEPLYERVEAEFRRYFTPSTGKPTGEFRQAAVELAEAQAQAQEAEQRLADADADAATRAALAAELADVTIRRADARTQRDQLAQAWTQIEAQRRQVEQAQAQLAAQEGARELGAQRQRQREELVVAVAARATKVQEARTRLHALEQVDLAERPAVVAARDRRELARQSAMEATTALRSAEAQVTERRRRAELVALVAKQEAAGSTLRELADVERQIDRCRVDEEALKAIEDAHVVLLQARVRAEQHAPQMTLRARSDVEVVIGGEPLSLRRGGERTQAVTGAINLRVGDLLDIDIAPDAGESERVAALWAAQDEHDRLCRAAGVRDLTQAREQAERRRELVRRRDHLAEETDRILGQLDEDELAHRISGLRAQVDADGPIDVEEAERARAAASAVLAAAQEEAADAEAEAQGRLEAQVERGEALAAARVGVDHADNEWRSLSRQLSDLRARQSDDELTGALAGAHVAVVAARQAVDAAIEELTDADPDSTQARLDNARLLVDRLAEEERSGHERLIRVDERLRGVAGAGLQDAADAAAARADAARRRYESLARRAAAARLLAETMRAARERAHRAYVEPFANQVRVLGRLVFGADFDIGVDQQLRIVDRTLHGITVPYESLSAGAQEQLAIVARLACAALVSPGEGVPVIFDDALGHSDHDRLARLGAAFTRAAAAAQVIVLTCVPERYQAIGGATVVRLEA
jgi:hypothetical protein